MLNHLSYPLVAMFRGIVPREDAGDQASGSQGHGPRPQTVQVEQEHHPLERVQPDEICATQTTGTSITMI